MAHTLKYVPPQPTYENRPAAPRHSVGVEDTVNVRRAETSDGDVLSQLASPEGVILAERFCSWDVPLLTEKSLLAITAHDAYDPSERACGYAAFSDMPNWAGCFDSNWSDLVSDETTVYNSANSIWLHLFFADHTLENDAMHTIISTAFATLSGVDFCLLAIPASTPLFKPLTNSFEEICRPPKELTNGKEFVIYASSRGQYIPEMFIRPARVEDHDDLLPVFGAQADTLNQRYGDYGLSDVLANQSESNRTLVAEVDGRAIGLISLNSDVELIKVLGSCFQLTSYDHLMKYPEGVIPPSLRAAQRKQYEEEDESDAVSEEEGELDLDDDVEENDHNTLTVNVPITSVSHVADDDVDVMDGSDAEEQEEEEQDEAMSEASSQGSEILEVEGMEPNAFAVTLFCIAEGFESRAYELLGPAFDAFPSRDFCVITLPHTSLEFPLLAHFNIVPPRFSGTFPQVLYVFHRHALLALNGQLSTRAATSEDLDDATDLCNTLENGRDVLEAFNLGLSDDGEDTVLKSFVAVADDALCGVVVIEPACDDAPMWRAKYRLDDYIDWPQHGDSGHCELVYFVVNPIFERSAKAILNDTMRLMEKTVIHHRVFTDQPVINVLRDLIPVRPRREIENVDKAQKAVDEAVKNKIAREDLDEEFDDQDGVDEFALYFLGKKHITEQKVVVNSRIVVVGASDTGIAFLEHLAFIPYLHFTSLSLVSEGGLPTGDTDHYMPDRLAYDESTYHKLSLRSKVRVVDDKLIGIDRELQLAVLPFDAIIPYDFLILTPGLQDQTASKLNLSENEYRGVFTLRNEHELDQLRSYAPLKRPDAPRRSIVYGRSLEALCAVQGLIESGEDPKDIVMCWPPKSQPFSCNEQISNSITDTLSEMGIRCYHDMTLERAESERGRIFAAIFEPSARAGLLGPLPTNEEYGDSGHDTPVVPKPPVVDVDTQPSVDANSGGVALPDLRLFCKNLILCVGHDGRDLDPDTHQAVDTACLVYDGRLVVDGEFRTNDPHIFAGGSVARFSRRLGREACQAYLDQFNSLEGGVKLAQALLTRVDPLSDGTLLLTDAAPIFEEPTTVSCILPGNLHYFHAEQIKKLTNHPVTTEGRHFTTVNKATADYCDIFVDKYNRISSIMYLGKTPVEAHNWRQLIGLPETLLNDLERRFDAGDIQDLPEFLRQPWTEAIYHDRFTDFRVVLGVALSELPEWEELATKAREMIDSDDVGVVNRVSVARLRGLLPPAANSLIKKRLMEWLVDNSNILKTYFVKRD